MLRLFQKMLRDIWKHKVQFASVFCMAFLGILIYAGIEGVWMGMQKESYIFYRDSNATTDWIIGTNFTEKDKENFSNKTYVIDASLSMVVDVQQIYKKNGKEEKGNLQVNTFDDLNMNIPYIYSGDGFNTDTTDGCWLDNNYAMENNIEEKDTIKIEYMNIQKELKVCGLINSPEYIGYVGSQTSMMPDHENYGYCYINEETMTDFLGEIYYNQLKLITEDKEEDTLDSDISEILRERFIINYDRDNYSGVSAFMSQIKQLKGMSFMFSALFILLSLLSMQTTMKRLVETQRIQIGTMKAVGFTDIQILGHYACYGFFVSTIGSLLGFIVAPRLITPILIEVQKDFYTLPFWIGKNTYISYSIITITIVLCTLITVLACLQSIYLVPAEAMRYKSIEEKDGRNGKLVQVLPFEWKWSVRYISRNKMRTLIGVIGVAGCIVLLMASLGLYDSLKYANRYLYGTQYTYDKKIVFSQAVTEEQKQRVIENANPDCQLASENVIQIKTRYQYYPSSVTVLDEGYYISFYNDVYRKDKQLRLGERDVIMSSKLADILNIKEGNSIKIKLASDNEYTTVVITDIIYMPAPQGIVLSKDCWENLGYDFSPTCAFLGEVNGLDYSYVFESTTLDEQYDSANTVLDSAISIVIMLTMAGLVLSVIILFNLGILNFTERMREYSTLKVLGFEDREIKDIIMRDTCITSFFGLIVGLPLGFLFLKLYVEMVSTKTFAYVSYITWYSMLAVIVVSIGCSFLVNLIIISKIKNLDMVEALKSVE